MPCSHGYLSPRELYEKAIKCRDGIFTIFGKTGIELLKAIEFYDHCYGQPMKQEQTKITNEEIERETTRLLDESNRFLSGLYKAKEQTKMTRDEATKLVAKACGVPVGAMGGGNIVDALEALGLLKFDEPEMVEWRCGDGIHRYPKGYDPNHNSGLVWTKVADKSQFEFLTIPVGPHTHEVALQMIIKALNAKGFQVHKYYNSVTLLISACQRFVRSKNTADEADALRCIETYTKELT